MVIEVEPRKATLREIKEGEVFKYEFDGGAYYCIKLGSPFDDLSEFNAVHLGDGTLLKLPISELVTPVRAKLVVEE